LDRLSHQVTRAGDEIVLQPREFRLLEYLMKHAGQVVTRTMLLENVWDYHFDPQTNVIDVHISRLRSKIDKGFTQALLHTVRGAGYMIRDSKWRRHCLRRAGRRAGVMDDRARQASAHDGVQADAGLSHGVRAVCRFSARLFRLEYASADHRTNHADGRCGDH